MDPNNLKTKVNYLFRSTMNVFQKVVCPYCYSERVEIVDRKYIVTKLVKCKSCQLNFRIPKDSARFLQKFYQNDYDVDTHIITKLPSDDILKKQMEENFKEVRNCVKYIRAANPRKNLKVIDYGCSWGYSLFQFKKEGYDVQGFEVSVPRADFGKKLGIEIVTDPAKIRKDNDIVLCSHVIEHLSDIKALFQTASTILKEDGMLIVWCPNGSEEYRKREPDLFHVNWGFLHPNYLDIQFATFALKDHPYLITTADWDYEDDVIAQLDKRSQKVVGRKDGKELLFITFPNIKL